MMLYLSAKDLLDLVEPNALVAAMEQALRDFTEGKVIIPARQHVDFGENTLLVMPVIGAGAFGVKVVSAVPGNASRGLPLVNGLMTLNDGVTGAPLAVLDAAMLTAQRTGAVGAVGIKHTTGLGIDRIGIIGIGVQGIWQAIFACSVRKVHTIYFIARSDKKAQRFINAVSRSIPSAVRLSRCADVQDLLFRSQVVITATSSRDPVLPVDRDRLKNKHFSSVGSFKPSMQELPNEVYELAQQVFVDTEAAKIEVGDLIGPISSGVLREADIVHIAEVVSGKRAVDTQRTTVFKSVGTALYDLYAAQTFLHHAQRLGRGTPLH
jgi:ornithine cyclodeaminase